MLNKRCVTMSSLFVLLIGLILMPLEISAQDIESQQMAAAQINGQVIDAQTESPIPNVRVEMPVVGKTATTDEEGNFTFENLNPGKYTLEINHEGYEQFSKEVEVPGQEGQVREEEQEQEQGQMGKGKEPLIIKLQPASPPNR